MAQSANIGELLSSLDLYSPSRILGTIAFTILLVISVQVSRQYYRLRHIPGPFLNALTPLVLTYHCIKGDITAYTYSLAEKYGPLVRVSPNIVMHSDPDTFRRVCSVKANYTKGLWFEFSRWSLERYSCIAMRDNESRKERKGMLMPAWAGQGLNIMEARVDRQVHAFLDLVERKYISTATKSFRPMEFGHRAQFFTLDVATGVTFGKAWGFLGKDGDVEKYLETTEAITPLFGILGSLPWLVYVMHAWPFNKAMPGEGDKVGFGRLMKLASEEVKIRAQDSPRSDTKQRPSLADMDSEHDLIRAYLRNGVEPEDAIQECITLIVAGTETTSITLRMAMLCLLTTPSAYRKVQAEIDAYYATKQQGSENIISFTDAKQHLPYLQAVIREAFRLWPPSAGLFSKQVPEGGDTIHGYYLPTGTEVGQSMAGVGRYPGIFGSVDAHIFRPERWLEATPEAFEEMQAAVDLVFSAGKYVCLGKQIAWMELLKFFVEVLKRYDIAVVNNARPLKLRDPVTFLTTEFWIHFTKREV